MSEMITPLERAVTFQEAFRTSLNHVGTLQEPCWEHVEPRWNHDGTKGPGLFSEPIDDLMGEALTSYAISHSLRYT